MHNFNRYLKFNDNHICLNELNRNIKSSKILYFMDNASIQNYNGYFSSDKINHVYTNLDLSKFKYAKFSASKWQLLFNELFIPSDFIQARVNYILPSSKFIVFSFRFQSLMGDFVDNDLVWDEKTKIFEVNKLIRFVEKYRLENFLGYKIYVTTDSSTFLKQLVEFCPNQYIFNPVTKADMNNHELSIIELLVMSKAQKVCHFIRPTMYAGAFSRYASYIGNIEYELIEV